MGKVRLALVFLLASVESSDGEEETSHQWNVYKHALSGPFPSLFFVHISLFHFGGPRGIQAFWPVGHLKIWSHPRGMGGGDVHHGYGHSLLLCLCLVSWQCYGARGRSQCQPLTSVPLHGVPEFRQPVDVSEEFSCCDFGLWFIFVSLLLIMFLFEPRECWVKDIHDDTFPTIWLMPPLLSCGKEQAVHCMLPLVFRLMH